MKFRFSNDFVVDSDVEPWRREGLRIAMLGGPGSGKSWNNSLIAEQFLTQSGTLVAFQPRDEYYTLKEKFDVLSVGGVQAKDMEFALTSPSIYAKAVVEDGISMIFYTSAATDEEKLIDWVSRFIRHLLNYQERHKRPLLLVLEEAQEYAPRTASGHVAPPWVYNRMIKAFKDCFTQGRKLNIMAIASSQRPQELNFTIRQLANLTFYGNFAAQDISYIEKECLKPYKDKGIKLDANELLALPQGKWLIIVGKRSRFITVTEPRLTKHGAETPRLEYVTPRTTEAKKTIDQLTTSILEALKKEEAERSEVEKAKRKIRDLAKKLAAAEEKAKIKLSVKEMLKAGSEPVELAEKLAKAEAKVRQLEERIKVVDVLEGKLAKAEDYIENVKVDIEKVQALDNFLEALESFRPKQQAGTPRFKIGLQPTTTIVDVPEAVKHVTISDDTVRGKILTLAKEGFFGSWRKLKDVMAELEKHRWTPPYEAVRSELPAMAKEDLLASKRTSSRQRLYVLSRNVKFKET